MSSYLGANDVTFIHVQPKPEDVTAQQNDFIHTDFELLESTASTGNTSLINGYPSLIDIPSFVDFMLISELSANPDAYQFSTYFHKDRNGKLNAGPIWDNNLTFGNDLFIWVSTGVKPIPGNLATEIITVPDSGKIFSLTPNSDVTCQKDGTSLFNPVSL